MTIITPAPSHAASAVTEAEAAIRERLAIIEAGIKTEEATLVNWVKKNWLHVANGAGIAATILKLFGKI